MRRNCYPAVVGRGELSLSLLSLLAEESGVGSFPAVFHPPPHAAWQARGRGSTVATPFHHLPLIVREHSSPLNLNRPGDMSNKPNKKRTIHNVQHYESFTPSTALNSGHEVIQSAMGHGEILIISDEIAASSQPHQPFDADDPTRWELKENCLAEALKYNTRRAFSKGSPSAYITAKRKEWLDDICQHMAMNVPQGFWNKKENCHAQALKYSSRSEFRKKCKNGFNSAVRKGWIDEVLRL